MGDMGDDFRAMRELRYRTLALVRATFQGFLALPAPAGKSWREVLGVPEDRTIAGEIGLKEFRRAAASKAHPDKGGTDAAMADVNRAYDQARQELGL